MNGQIVIATLQKKVSELTLVNVMLEAQIQDLQTQLNSIIEQKTSDAITDGNENQAQEIDNSDNRPDDF
jgi:cell division protein FtsB